MRKAGPGTSAALAVLATAVCWSLASWWIRAGNEPLPQPWTAPALTALMSPVLLRAGLRVRRRMVDPLVAARTAVLAVACVHTGALLVGWYLGQALALVPDLVGQRRTFFVLGLLGTAASIALAAAGLLVQRWCSLPPPDDPPDDLQNDPREEPGDSFGQ
ncbi:MAG: hypothetical protein QG608_1757 [Actinomycetota bacterium]|nr:hypothetical protein [Actinomycetota bacterium]